MRIYSCVTNNKLLDTHTHTDWIWEKMQAQTVESESPSITHLQFHSLASKSLITQGHLCRVSWGLFRSVTKG